MVPVRSLAVLAVAVAAITALIVGLFWAAEPVSSPTPGAAGVAARAHPTRDEGGTPPCPPAAITDPVPALSGVSARCLGAPGPVDVGAVVAGPPTLLNLWASWCAPCREEMPVLDAYAATPDAVRVIGVNVTDRPDAAAALMRDLMIRYPSLTDADDVQRALGTPPLLPLSYLVTGDGAVRRLQDVLVFDDPAQVRTSVAAALRDRGIR